VAVPQGPTAGALLRQAREAAGLHVAALAVALKVPVRKLEALEEDRYDLMPDNVFVRGLASSVCRTLKIDPQPILDRLPQTAAPRLVRDNEGINTPFRAPSDGAPPRWFEYLTRPGYLAVLALLVGAVVLILLPVAQRDEPANVSKVELPAVPQTAPLVIPSEPPAVALQPGPALKPASSTAAVALKPTPALAPAPVALAPMPAASVPGNLPTVASAPGAPVSGTVVFRAKGPSWVEVTDAKGVVAIRKVLAAGEAAGASGALPLRVTVGRTDMTDVQVRGKPFDLSSFSRDNVARFEVK